MYDSVFLVDVKYKPWKPIGRGAYGQVCSALDEQTKKKIAIKKVTNAFEDLVDAKRILREIKLLRHFNHENVVGIVDLIEVIFSCFVVLVLLTAQQILTRIFAATAQE